MPERIKILYVDDEEQNLVSFKANFRKLYDVYTASSAFEALGLLKHNAIPIIISDQKMPYTSGVEFLEQTVKLYPDCVRLLITAHSDIEVVIEAINRGQISKYIQKPWDWEKLAMAIDNCITLYTSQVELKAKNAELQKANTELNKFVYSVSHDLRAPLTSILGVVNLTKLRPELKVAEEYFNIIESRVLKLDDFIKKIIDYYKNARTEIITEKIIFSEFIKNILETFENQYSDIVFNLEIKNEIDFYGDAFRLKIIFENLISNAVKYQNPSAKIKTVDLIINSSLDKLQMVISDNGIGIEEKFSASIFELFFRAEDTLNTEGTGIGLYLVKESVEKMNGTISVKSQKRVGTSFEISIPNKLKL